MIKIYIDPSYTGTACCTVKDNKEVEFKLFSRAQSKRELLNYIHAAFELRDELKDYLDTFMEEQPNVIIYMEAPFPGGISSPGLYLLQGLYQDMLHKHPAVGAIYSISPNWVSMTVKKLCDKKDGTSVRKDLCKKYLSELPSKGYVFPDTTPLKLAGADVATAFIFWVETERQGRDWKRFK